MPRIQSVPPPPSLPIPNRPRPSTTAAVAPTAALAFTVRGQKPFRGFRHGARSSKHHLDPRVRARGCRRRRNGTGSILEAAETQYGRTMR